MALLPRRSSVRLALLAILLLSLVGNLQALSWGLPNGNQTWAADSLPPVTSLSVARRVWFGEPWNSGWFYFKYPVGHPLVVVAAQSPYLLGAVAAGELGKPTNSYPYGFRHPERSLAWLAWLSRLPSALLGTGVVFLAFRLGAMLLGPMAGLGSAIATAGCYPFVFYAHTSNVDVPLLFWLALALVATVWSARGESPARSLLVGVAAAMALLTKEQSLGVLAALPLVWLVVRWGEKPCGPATLLRHGVLAGGAFALVTVVVANVPWNPSGYLHRWQFLLGSLPAEVREKYAPYQFMIQVPKGFSLAREMEKLGRVLATVAHGLTWPGTLSALAGLVILAVRRPRSLAVLGIVAAIYYALSLRALELVQVRYVMPLLLVGTLLAGTVLSEGLRRWRAAGRGGRVAIAGALSAWFLLLLLPGADVIHLLRDDPRYEAEFWLRETFPAGTRSEFYQEATYLPRFPAEWEVTRVPVPGRSAAALAERSPELIVLSGGAQAGLTGEYAENWQPGQPVFSESEEARDFVTRLRDGELGYRLDRVFRTEPWWIRPRIHSLNPAIEMFRRRNES